MKTVGVELQEMVRQLPDAVMILLAAGAVTSVVCIAVPLGPGGLSHGEPWRRRLRRTSLLAAGTTLPLAVVLKGLYLSAATVAGLAVCCWTVFLLRMARVGRAPRLSHRRLHLLTVLDFAACGAVLVFARSWMWALVDEQVLSPMNVFGLPACYALVCAYFVYNHAMMSPERVELAAWRLLSYAFPPGDRAADRRAGRPNGKALRPADVLTWAAVLGAVVGSWLVGYVLAGRIEATICVLAAILLGAVVVLMKPQLRTARRVGWRGRLAAIFLGSGLIVVALLIVVLLTRGRLLLAENFTGRTLVGMVLALPVALSAVDFLPTLAAYLRRRVLLHLKASGSWEPLRAVTAGVSAAALPPKRAAATQALLLAGVLLGYHVLPRMQAGLRAAGVAEIAGRDVSEVLRDVRAATSAWTMPGDFTWADLGRFVIGSHGLVLLFVLWSMVALLSCVAVHGRLRSVPNLCLSRAGRAVAAVHMALFYLYFLLIILSAAMAIPWSASTLGGGAIPLIVGVFVLGLYLPKLQAGLLSLGWLAGAVIDTDMVRDAVCLNTASREELARLPGIGPNRAERIIRGRPYNTRDDLRQVGGLEPERVDRVRPLVRA